MPTAPAATTRSTLSATASGVDAYACSKSALTGTFTARAIRATASIISRAGTTPPSGYPMAAATPALVVAIAGNPSASKIRALAASHAFGITKMGGARCSDRSRSAASVMGTVYAPLSAPTGNSGPSVRGKTLSVLRVLGGQPRTSFGSKRVERIESGRASRGDVTRHERDGEQQRRHCYEGGRIGCADAEQQRRHHPRRGAGRGNANNRTDRDHRDALTHHHQDHVAPLGAKRDADTDLVRALGYRISHDAVDADRGERQREGGEQSEQDHVEA